MSILRRIPLKEISVAASTVWSDKATASKVALDADEIISRTYKRKFAFFTGKSSKCLVSGLFYILGFRYDAVVKQRALADKMGTSDVTIRASYKQWLETFPDLFLDVLGKLAQNAAFRCYVLSELKLKQNLSMTASSAALSN
ncbi:MAG: hypothetical protein NWF05_02055 [Candidatus Bathyarchaeota archaeon]|nr:hypothetical protein [Candidatus Bathyarchaeota archaeon]